MQKLNSYFTDGIKSRTLKTMGAEVETQFVDKNNNPISKQKSQRILKHLLECGWSVDCKRGDLVTVIVDSKGNKIFYELGRHNMEVATATSAPDQVLELTRECLNNLYNAANKVGALPYFAPILHGVEDLLIIPDERDANWLKLDGRDALATLARISSVQFTVSVAPKDALRILNAFGEHVNSFLADFPQDIVWKEYVANSSAGYLSYRYGGPLGFESLDNYCRELAKHDVVKGTHLVPINDVDALDIPLYLRSVWWHFRFKRYGDDLCIEVRPIPRRTDDQLKDQLEKVLEVVCA